MKATERAYYAKLVQLGCIVCLNNGIEDSAPEIHHPRMGNGMGKKAPYTEAIPLCHAHHRTGGVGVAYHAAPETWESKYGSQERLVAQVKSMLGEMA